MHADTSGTHTILTDERELDVLAHVHAASDRDARHSQRSIARALGMSVGLTNAILKRLAQKGLVMMRRVNHNNVHYLVTPEGVEEVSRRSYLYVRRTVGHVVRYRDRLREFCRTQRQAGVEEIVLVGESDVAFILEWAAMKEGLSFLHVAEDDAAESPAGTASGAQAGRQAHRLSIYAESLEAPDGCCSLPAVLLGSDGNTE